MYLMLSRRCCSVDECTDLLENRVAALADQPAVMINRDSRGSSRDSKLSYETFGIINIDTFRSFLRAILSIYCNCPAKYSANHTVRYPGA